MMRQMKLNKPLVAFRDHHNLCHSHAIPIAWISKYRCRSYPPKWFRSSYRTGLMSSIKLLLTLRWGTQAAEILNRNTPSENNGTEHMHSICDADELADAHSHTSCSRANGREKAPSLNSSSNFYSLVMPSIFISHSVWLPLITHSRWKFHANSKISPRKQTTWWIRATWLDAEPICWLSYHELNLSVIHREITTVKRRPTFNGQIAMCIQTAVDTEIQDTRIIQDTCII